MKKLKKVLAVALAATLAVGCFAGCSNGSDKDDQGRTKISVCAWPQKEGKDLDNANAKKARFEEANPDVVVEGSAWTFDRKTFYAKAAGGQLPTLFNTAYTEVAEIISSEYSANLSDVLKKRGYDGMFNEDIMKIVSNDDGVWAFPISAYVLGLSYNVDLFEAAGLMNADGTPKQPKDWNELAEFAVKIKNATGKSGFVFPTSSNMGGWIFTPVAWSYGVEFIEKDSDGKWVASFDTPECVAALQYIKDLKWKYDVLPSNSIIDGTEYYKTFATGNAGMMITAGDVAKYCVQYDMNVDSLGIMALPAGPKKHVTLLGGSVYCVSENSTEDQIDAAIRWLELAYNFNATDEFKKNKTNEIQKQLDDGQLVGIKSMSVWSGNAEGLKFEQELIDEKANSNPNHVKLYNDFVANCPAEIHAEIATCAQELYGILDGCIQEVLTNKNADCEKLIKGAVSDFQKNYLDNLTY